MSTYKPRNNQTKLAECQLATQPKHKKTLFPNTNLNKQESELNILPELKDNSLLSVCKLSDAGYTNIFHTGDRGVTVH